MLSPFFFFNDTATTEIYTLSLHDALPISHCFYLPVAKLLDRYAASVGMTSGVGRFRQAEERKSRSLAALGMTVWARSEEHTSELQSPCNLVCRLLLEKKNTRLVHSLLMLD